MAGGKREYLIGLQNGFRLLPRAGRIIFTFIYFRLFFGITNASPCAFQNIHKERACNDNYIQLHIGASYQQSKPTTCDAATIKLCHAGYCHRTTYHLPE